MKTALAIYWLVGCLIIGSAIGNYKNRCPNDETPTAQATFFGVMAWPAFVTSAATWKGASLVCKRLP